jgi:hypothetical protein
MRDYGGANLVLGVVGAVAALFALLPELTRRLRVFFVFLGVSIIAVAVAPIVFSLGQESSGRPSSSAGPTTDTRTATQTPQPTTVEPTTPTASYAAIRGPHQLVLQRAWAVDLDSGKQSAMDNEDTDLVDDTAHLTPKDGVEIAEIIQQAGKPEACENTKDRIGEIPIWLSAPRVKSGQQFCIYTNSDNIAIMRFVERREAPVQASVFSVTVWSKLP